MKKILNFLIALFLILNCNTVYTAQVNKNYYFKEILLIIIIIMLLFKIKNKEIEKIRKTNLIFLIISFAYLFIFFCLRTTSGSTRIDYMYLFFAIFPLLYFMYSSSRGDNFVKDILQEFTRVVLIISIVSLIFYFLGTILKIIKLTDTITINWGTTRTIKSYYGIHFDIQRQEIFGNTIIRNTGIFTEAPMYNLILTIALAIELFLNQKESKIKVIIFLLTIITTLSTTGIVISIGLIIAKFINGNKKQKILQYIKILWIPLIVIGGAYMVFIVMGEKKGSASYNTRMDDFKASFLAWQDEPILGNGYKNNESIIQYMSKSRIANTGLSNSMLVLLAQGGIYLSIFYLIPFIKLIKYGLKYKDNNIIIFTITMMILFITTIFLYKPIAINFIAMGYAFNSNQNAKKMEDKNVLE